jgi:hypothetical protein
MISLSNLKPFAKGGNRLCFEHPDDKTKVIKVRRPDFTLQDLRKKKGFPKSLKPLSSFDDNKEEFNVLKHYEKAYGDLIFTHVCRCYGFEDTDLGKGLVLELVRDGNGLISYNIKQYLYEIGPTASFLAALDEFCSFWQQTAPPSRNLLAHNILVQQDSNQQVKRLVVIDGLGNSGLFPTSLLSKRYRQKKAQKKLEYLRASINSYIDRVEKGEKPSDIGILFHRGN